MMHLNGALQTDYLELIIWQVSEQFPHQTAEVSESALHKAPSKGNCRLPGKSSSNEQHHKGLHHKCGKNIEKMWDFHCTTFLHGKQRVPAGSRVLHFTSMTRRMGISKADTRGKCLLLHGTAATTEGAVSPKCQLQPTKAEQ